MSVTIRNEALELANILTGPDSGLVTPSQVEPLIRLARRYAKIQERWCSEDMSGTPGLQERVQSEETRLEEEIRKIAKSLKGVVGVKFTGDPRGYCVRLLLASGKYNTWGGAEDGWGVA